MTEYLDDDDYVDGQPASSSLNVGLLVALLVFGIGGGLLAMVLMMSGKPADNKEGEGSVAQRVERPANSGQRLIPGNEPITEKADPAFQEPPAKKTYPQLEPGKAQNPDIPSIEQGIVKSPALDAVKAFLLKRINDTDGFEIVDASKPTQVKIHNTNATLIRVAFRAKNEVGAKVLKDNVYWVSDGKVIQAMSAQTYKLMIDGDKFFDALSEQFKEKD